MCTNRASVILDFVGNNVTLYTSKDGNGGHSAARDANGLKKVDGRTWRQYEVFIDGQAAFDSKVDATVDNIELRLDDALPGFEDTVTFNNYGTFLDGVVSQVNARRQAFANPTPVATVAAAPAASTQGALVQLADLLTNFAKSLTGSVR